VKAANVKAILAKKKAGGFKPIAEIPPARKNKRRTPEVRSDPILLVCGKLPLLCQVNNRGKFLLHFPYTRVRGFKRESLRKYEDYRFTFHKTINLRRELL